MKGAVTLTALGAIMKICYVPKNVGNVIIIGASLMILMMLWNVGGVMMPNNQDMKENNQVKVCVIAVVVLIAKPIEWDLIFVTHAQT